MFGSVRSTASSAIRVLEYTTRQEGTPFSIRGWVKHGAARHSGGRGGASRTPCRGCVSPADAAFSGSSRSVRCRAPNGRAVADTIVENCGNTLILRCSASERGGTSEFASKLIGQRQVVHTTRSRSRRSSEWVGTTTTSEHNVTTHPSAAWTLQQLRESTGFQRRYDYLLHDRDSIFAQHLDESVKKLGIKVLKSPPRSPMANAICERVIGTIRRECLDWLIPLSASHLQSTLEIVDLPLQCRAPPHGAGPGCSRPAAHVVRLPTASSRHRHGESYAVCANPILGGLHHEYSLAPSCA